VPPRRPGRTAGGTVVDLTEAEVREPARRTGLGAVPDGRAQDALEDDADENLA
jgi:hypothetical protein